MTTRWVPGSISMDEGVKAIPSTPTSMVCVSPVDTGAVDSVPLPVELTTASAMTAASAMPMSSHEAQEESFGAGLSAGCEEETLSI